MSVVVMVEKIQPVSAGLFPSLAVRSGFSFTNCLKDWEGMCQIACSEKGW